REVLFVAGSTHRGEDEIILTAFKELSEEFPALRLAIAPRHPERFGEVEGLIKKNGLAYDKRSTLQMSAKKAGGSKAGKGGKGAGAGKSKSGSGSGKIFLLDSMGELASLYELSHICFVGGSLVPGVGGHNLLEPAGLGRPVLFGPYVHTCEATAELLTSAGGGVMVSDHRELSAELKKLVSDKKTREAMGGAARVVVEKNRGAVEKSLKVINGLLK
ncbi:MAG: 3-deoxy-D-manno-octulosonic acid transferase, partial [Thermodesulfobacteriota bacterium]